MAIPAPRAVNTLYLTDFSPSELPPLYEGLLDQKNAGFGPCQREEIRDINQQELIYPDAKGAVDHNRPVLRRLL